MANSSWEEIATDPFSGPFKEGQENGKLSGQEAGYSEGYSIGRTTALNYGLELGYIEGFLSHLNSYLGSQVLEGELSMSQARRRRIEKSAENLRASLDDFPSPRDVIAMRGNQIITATAEGENIIEPESLEEGDGVDVEAKMQRIRARFKLFCVQLDPHIKLQLASIMEEVTLQGSLNAMKKHAAAIESMPGDRSW